MDVAAADDSARRLLAGNVGGICSRNSGWRWLTAACFAILLTLAILPHLSAFTCSEQPRHVIGPQGVPTPSQKTTLNLLESQPDIPVVEPATVQAKSVVVAEKPRSSSKADVPPPPESMFPNLPVEFWLLYKRYSAIEPQHSVLDGLLLHNEKFSCPKLNLTLIIEWFQYSEETMQRVSGTEMADHQSHIPGADKHVAPHHFYGRNAELLAVLQMNLLHPDISGVHVRVETQAEADLCRRKLYDPCDKLMVTSEPSSYQMPDGRWTNNRTFAHMLEYANRALPKGDLFLLTHADIILGEGMELLHEAKSRTPTPFDFDQPALMMLSRHGLDIPECHTARDGKIGPEDQCHNYQGSHDTIIAKAPVTQALIDATRFSRSQLGSENLFIFKANNAGYHVTNPCGNVRTYHSHCSALRIDSHYGERLNQHGQSAVVSGSYL
jgi:hypothetical protein